ncbi:MAG: FAD-binding oxidoreductase [Synechococcaceae cyanobacterium]
MAVRGGGHNVAGLAGADQAVTIDLSRMRNVRVDPVQRHVRVEAGALLGHVDRATQAFQLVVPTGVVSETGIAGLILSGGLGWLRRKWGRTCDNLIAADLVCADGAHHRVSCTEQPELLWALRGGGGNFGIVTAFEFQAHPLGPDVMFCFVVYPDNPELMARYADFIATEPEEIGTLAFTGTVPAADTFPRDSWGCPFFVVAACYAGSVAEGQRALQPLRELGTPIADLSAAMPFVEAQKFLDEEYPTAGTITGNPFISGSSLQRSSIFFETSATGRLLLSPPSTSGQWVVHSQGSVRMTVPWRHDRLHS